jgi:transitional endoplasmic reticulum ATPase
MLAERTENYSGADLEMLCREAGMLALRQHIKPQMSREELILDEITVTREHFETACGRIRPHLSREMLDEYTQMIRDFEV